MLWSSSMFPFEASPKYLFIIHGMDLVEHLGYSITATRPNEVFKKCIMIYFPQLTLLFHIQLYNKQKKANWYLNSPFSSL